MLRLFGLSFVFLLFLCEAIHCLSNGDHITEAIHGRKTINEDLFLGVEVDREHSAKFSGDVHTVDEFQSVCIGGQLPRASVADPFVTTNERTARTRISGFHFPFDSGIFADIQEAEGAFRQVLFATRKALDGSRHFGAILVGSVQDVADFVADQHIIDIARHLFPDREGQGLSATAPRGGGNVGAVDNADILGREELGEQALGFPVDGRTVIRLTIGGGITHTLKDTILGGRSKFKGFNPYGNI